MNTLNKIKTFLLWAAVTLPIWMFLGGALVIGAIELTEDKTAVMPDRAYLLFVVLGDLHTFCIAALS